MAIPIANALGLLATDHHIIALPTALLWWWLVGLTLDDRGGYYRGLRKPAMEIGGSVVNNPGENLKAIAASGAEAVICIEPAIDGAANN